MSEPAFIASGDLHLNPLIWRKYRQISGDAFYGFTQVVDLGLELYVPIVLVGDIFDSVDPSPDIIRFFRQQMDRCMEDKLPVYVIQGNHDKRPSPWPHAVHDWPIYIGEGKKNFTINGVSCRGYDYATRDEIQEQLEHLGTLQDLPQVVFLHQAVKQAIPWEGSWNCDLEWVPEKVPLVVMGDIHKEWEAPVRPGQMAYYTNATHARNMSELGQKSVLVVNKDLTCARAPLTSRSVAPVAVSTDEEFDQFTTVLSELVSDTSPLAPVAFVRHTPEFAERVIAASLESQNVHLIREEVALEEGETLVLDLTEEQEFEISLAGMLAKVLDPDVYPDEFQMVLELLDETHIPGEILKKHRDKYINAE